MEGKKWISAILIGAAVMGLLAGCSSSTESSQGPAAQGTEPQNVEEDAGLEEAGQAEDETGSDIEEDMRTDEDTAAENTSDSEAAGGKTLVVYYSATGNTEAVANDIADATGGDLFELEPAEPYTEEDLNYNDENSRVSREYEDESLRDVELVSTTVEGFDEYENIFVGYPVWWGIAAWPVDSFVENNDFTGKTVIPFCTSASSGIGDSGQLLADMAGTGNWLEGQRFRSSVDEAEVQEWVNGLGL